VSVIERCARSLYAQAGKKWLESYPFESDHPVAVEARERATEQARRVLAAADYEGTVASLASIADELRALGQEWREEWPDGRVCKSALNEIADRLVAIGGQ
jgi:hypothetical protein